MILNQTRVHEATASTGTGNVTLAGAETGLRTFYDACNTGTRFEYMIADAATGAWEEGVGYLSAATTLVRDVVLRSSNANAAVSFGSGTKDVFLFPPASAFAALPRCYGDGSDGDVTISGTGNTLAADMQYRVVTWAAGATLLVTGGRLFCQTLDMSAATVAASIYSVGAAGAAGAATLGGLGGTGTLGGADGGDGGASMYAGSTAGGSSNGGSGGLAGIGGGRGGVGGTGTYGRGGKSGANCPWPAANILAHLLIDYGNGGGGGGGNGGHSTTTMYYGGGGGEGAPGISIFCRKFIRPTAGVAGMIRSTGGAGANASVSNALAGSGSGGGGGRVSLVYEEVSGATTTNLLRSIGGNGGTNTTAGVGGYGGYCATINLSTGIVTTSGPTANSTTTGGTTSLAS
jgi:hypothetical protein